MKLARIKLQKIKNVDKKNGQDSGTYHSMGLANLKGFEYRHGWTIYLSQYNNLILSFCSDTPIYDTTRISFLLVWTAISRFRCSYEACTLLSTPTEMLRPCWLWTDLWTIPHFLLFLRRLDWECSEVSFLCHYRYDRNGMTSRANLCLKVWRVYRFQLHWNNHPVDLFSSISGFARPLKHLLHLNSINKYPKKDRPEE